MAEFCFIAIGFMAVLCVVVYCTLIVAGRADDEAGYSEGAIYTPPSKATHKD